MFRTIVMHPSYRALAPLGLFISQNVTVATAVVAPPSATLRSNVAAIEPALAAVCRLAADIAAPVGIAVGLDTDNVVLHVDAPFYLGRELYANRWTAYFNIRLISPMVTLPNNMAHSIRLMGRLSRAANRSLP
jgi:hypothetical protein